MDVSFQKFLENQNETKLVEDRLSLVWTRVRFPPTPHFFPYPILHIIQIRELDPIVTNNKISLFHEHR